jgi:hypothetical protein
MANLGMEIDKDSIKPNSHKYKAEQANEDAAERDKLSPIVKKGGVVSTKKPLGQKFADTFLSEDTDDIKSYVLWDVIIPGIQNTILDVMEMAFFGTSSGRNRSRSRRRRDDDRTDYRSSYRSSSSRDRDRSSSNRVRERQRDDKLDYRNIVLRNRDDTEEVIDEMRRRIRKQGAASIADLFDLIDEPSNYNDNNWGWKDERDIDIRRVSRGYLIDVEEAEYLD